MRRAILLAAFGPSNPYGRSGLAGFERLCRSRFPAWPIRWAYTSPLLRERLARQRQKSDSVAKALWRLHFEKFDTVAIQPLQTLPGREYEDVCSAVEAFRCHSGIACAVGKPLLGAPMAEVTGALLGHIPNERQPGEDVVFMGHGAKHPAQAMYLELSAALAEMDRHAFIGTMSGSLALDKLLPKLTAETVWLLPLLASIGQHALRDMAGAEETSWQKRLERAGYMCRPVLAGMAESPGLAAIWLDHLGEAVRSLGAP